MHNEIKTEDILKAKGFYDYFKNIDPKILNKRLLTGWINKRSKGAVKYYQLRWYIMVSARPIVHYASIL